MKNMSLKTKKKYQKDVKFIIMKIKIKRRNIILIIESKYLLIKRMKEK